MQSNLAQNVADPALPAIGEAIAGGFVGAFLPNAQGGLDALIVSPKAYGQTRARWKTSRTRTEGTSSYIDGLANSNAMNDDNHPATQFCRGLTVGGFDDWYLPASAEQAALWANLGPNHTPIAAFQSGAEEAYDPDWHFSSTEFSSVYAWVQGFDDGFQDFDGKDNEHLVRAVRRMTLI